MKNILLVFALSLALPILASAQSNSKLEQAVSVNAISTAQAKNQVKYLEFKANNCFSTQDLSGKKDISNQTDISALNALKISPEVADISGTNFNKATFNPLLYKTDQIKNMAYYRVGDTGVLLKLFSEEYCQSTFKK